MQSRLRASRAAKFQPACTNATECSVSRHGAVLALFFDMRLCVSFVVLLLGAAFTASTVGCAFESEGTYSGSGKPKRKRVADGGSTSEGTEPTEEPDDPMTTTVTPDVRDAGSRPSPVIDGGVVTPNPTNDAFTGAPTFASRTGPSARQNAHANSLGNANPARRDCLGCHNGNNGPRFTFGGTVFTTAQGTQPAAGVEVRLRSGTQAISAYTDADGNFYSTAGTLPALAGVRNGTRTHLMTGQARGGCNGCHNGNTQPYLSVQ